jgi:hypothetical protein
MEVAAFNRPIWQLMKKRKGWDKIPNRDIPGFYECLQEMYDGGYSFSDIAIVFGYSREYIRQLFRAGDGLVATEAGALLRLWDDDLERFVPCTREDCEQRQRDIVRKRRAIRRAEIRAYAVDELRTLHFELGRQPTINEFGERLGFKSAGGCASMIRSMWDGGRAQLSYAETLDEIYECAGIERQNMVGKTEKSVGAMMQGRLKRWR